MTFNNVTRKATSTYDGLGHVTSTTDPLGHTAHYRYDAAGDVTETIFADGSSITDRYDSQGKKIAEIDQDGRETDYQYDPYAHLIAVVEPAVLNPATGGVVRPECQYAYDQYGDRTSTMDPLGRTTAYTYDPLGRMLTETLPMNQRESWAYNSVGELTSFTDFNGNTTDYTGYDNLGRVTQKLVYAYGSNTAYETVTYAYNVNYDAQGDYHDTVTDSLAGTTDYEYDVNGNLIKITSPQGKVNYSYDLATGLETEVSSPDPVAGTLDTDIHYVHDAAGELISVTINSLDNQVLSTPLVTTYSFDLDGNVVSTQDANGVVETRSYDVLNRLTVIADDGASGMIASFAYAYDPAGNLLTETDLGGRTDTYSHDNLGRLTQQVISDSTTGSSTLSWAYDLVGNRLTSSNVSSAGALTYTYSYNANDELTSISGPSSYLQSYNYDADGNTTTVSGSGGASSATYTWDPRGRLIAASTGGATMSFTYDDSDTRTSETTGGQTTTFLNDPNQIHDQVLEQYATGGVLAATYVRGLDLLFEDRGSARSYYLQDNLGSTRALANSSGILTDTAAYDAYGNLIASSGTTSNPYLFTGEWFDSAIGQYYLRARYMNPYIGRFSSMDSYAGDIRDPLSLQRYSYAHGDPIDLVDPSGHRPIVNPSIVRAVLAKLAKHGKKLDPAMCATLVLRALIGIRVTYILGDDYIFDHPLSVRGSIYVNKAIGRKGDSDLPTLVVDRIVPLFKMRPDILDLTEGTVYEIKGWLEEGAARAEVLAYIGILAFRYPGRLFLPGLWSPDKNPYYTELLPGIQGFTPFFFYASNKGGGAITYWTYPPEEIVEAMVFAAVSALARANIANAPAISAPVALGGAFGLCM